MKSRKDINIKLLYPAYVEFMRKLFGYRVGSEWFTDHWLHKHIRFEICYPFRLNCMLVSDF